METTINVWKSIQHGSVTATASQQPDGDAEGIAVGYSSAASWRNGGFAAAVSGGEVPAVPSCQK